MTLACSAEPTVLEEEPPADTTGADTSGTTDTTDTGADTGTTGDTTGEPDTTDTGDVGLPTVEDLTCDVDADCLGKVFVKPCTKPACEGGTCGLQAGADNVPCDDGDPCFVGRTCSNAKCQGGTPLPCDDGDICTADGCDVAQGGCIHIPKTGPCNDGNACTLADHCEDGVCKSGFSSCNCTSDADCTKFNSDNPCDGTLSCLAGVCQTTPGSQVKCPPGQAGACSVFGCNPATGQCGEVPVENGAACTDSAVCTVGDECIDGQCISGSPGCPCTDDASCIAYDDGNLCNGVMRCNAGQCVADPSTVVSCDVSNPCAAGACDPKTGQCSAQPSDGAPCDDGSACTTGDVCEGGGCVGESKACEDSNPCTDDLCDPSGECVFTPNEAACDDLDECTTVDLCQGGVCVGLDDKCSCTKKADCLAFEDGDPCNGTLTCFNGKCQAEPGTEVQCDPSQNTDCLANKCAPGSGTCQLVPVNQGNPCFDGDPCTDDETCTDGQCKATGGGCSCVAGQQLKCNQTIPWANDAFGATTNVDTWPCAPGDYTGPEYAFPFKVNQPSEVSVKLSNEVGATDVFVLEDTGNGCSPNNCGAAAVSKLSFLAEPDKTYYVVVDGKKGSAGKFDITTTCSTAIETNCEDGFDDDDDGQTDCNDSDCATDLSCGQTENCGNGVDDDDDALVDCADPQCDGTDLCNSLCYPNDGSYCGLSQIFGTDGGSVGNNISEYGCAFQPYDGPEFIYSFNATSSQLVTVNLQQSFPGHSIFVMQDLGGGCNAQNCLVSGPNQVSFFASAGVAYFIAIDGANKAKGQYKIKIECQ